MVISSNLLTPLHMFCQKIGHMQNSYKQNRFLEQFNTLFDLYQGVSFMQSFTALQILLVMIKPQDVDDLLHTVVLRLFHAEGNIVPPAGLALPFFAQYSNCFFHQSVAVQQQILNQRTILHLMREFEELYEYFDMEFEGEQCSYKMKQQEYHQLRFSQTTEIQRRQLGLYDFEKEMYVFQFTEVPLPTGMFLLK